MANIITLTRFIMLFILVALVYTPKPALQLINAPLLALIFILDGVDGYVARKRRETSLFGALFDIAADRVVENVLWLVLVDLDIIPVWVAIVFLARSFVVDSIRSQGASGHHRVHRTGGRSFRRTPPLNPPFSSETPPPVTAAQELSPCLTTPSLPSSFSIWTAP